MIQVINTIDELRKQVKEWKKAGLTVGLCPTMGYLHEGHASLMDAARAGNDKVVALVFVNPIQFGPNEDLATYPRDLNTTASFWKRTAWIWYSTRNSSGNVRSGFHTTFRGYERAFETLCEKTRPIHFRVCTVIVKLLNTVTRTESISTEGCPAAGHHPSDGSGSEF